MKTRRVYVLAMTAAMILDSGCEVIGGDASSDAGVDAPVGVAPFMTDASLGQGDDARGPSPFRDASVLADASSAQDALAPSEGSPDSDATAPSDATLPMDGSVPDGAQDLGDAGSSGWTTILPTMPSGEGQTFSGAGSRIIYVSNSGGNDSQPGTQAAPVATLAHGLSLLRDGYPDELLLKKGDTWTGESFDYLRVSGQSATAPMLFSSYGTGARPLVKVNSSGDATAIGSCCGHSTGNFLAIIGLELYAYTRDPASPDYAPSLKDINGLFFTNPVDWLLVEDCKFSFFSTNIVVEIMSGLGNLTIRRNVIVDAYSLDAHSQGLYLDGLKNIVLEENLLDHNGWNATLTKPVSATVAEGSPGVVTWPGTPLFPNGAMLYASQSGGGLTAGKGYYVVNLSGKTFNLSLSSGGAPIAVTSGAKSPQDLQWGDAAATIFNRNLYNNYTNGPITFTGNISSNSSAEGAQFRSGGSVTDNLFVMDSEGFTIGMDPGTDGPDIVAPVITVGTATNNVVLESTDIAAAPTLLPRAAGIGILNASGSGIQVTNNIVAHAGGSMVNQIGINPDGDVSGASVTGNIICSWRVPLEDDGMNDVTSPNVTKAASCAGLGFPNPDASVESYDATLGGAGTLADFIARARLQSKDNWSQALMGHAVDNYIRQSFGVAPIAP